jgi:hypothetical protein
MFLSADELIVLTGRRQKLKQIATLRKMGIAFYVNAAGRPVVARSAVEGKTPTEAPKPKWQPAPA